MIIRLLFRCLIGLSLCWLAGCSTVSDEAGIRYKVKIRGADDGAVKKGIKESSAVWKLRKRLPATLGQLHRRVDQSLPVIEAVMQSHGYYAGEVGYAVDAGRDPVRVVLDLDLDDAYRYGEVTIVMRGTDDASISEITTLLRRGRQVNAREVFAEERRILDIMKRRGYPFARLVRRKVDVDDAAHRVHLHLVFDPGRKSFFGPVEVEGLSTLKPIYIRRQLPWREGDLYDAGEVDAFEKKLLASGLFGIARIEPVKPENESASIPLNIRVSERNKRTIRLGLSYSDIGPGGKIYWEHRSFLGGGERLQSSLFWNPIRYGGEGSLLRTGFLGPYQSLLLKLEGGIETPDAYDARKAQTSGMVLRDFTPHIQGGLGVGYKYSLVEQFDETDRYGYVFFPVQAVLDYRDSKLNPTRGAQLFAGTAHYEGTMGADSFLKSEAELRQYLMWWETYRLSSAVRLTVGSIDGAELSAVPADERFYAGGGGSIRGYEYQSVGPYIDDTPTGGSKLLEFSAELRLQPGARLGYAVFVDGGTVYNELSGAERDRSLRYGAGAGLRWFTGIGPLRADLAYPLNPDENQPERLQFYISLGQAF